MPPCAGGPTEALDLPRPLSSRRKTAIQEVEVSPCDSMTGRSEVTSIQGKEEAHTTLEQTHDQLQLSYIIRSKEEDDDSLALFDPDDFSRETWTDLIYQRIDPPLGKSLQWTIPFLPQSASNLYELSLFLDSSLGNDCSCDRHSSPAHLYRRRSHSIRSRAHDWTWISLHMGR